ncbi:hypothetical protein AALC75_01870 [Lachnospiraceae bacterium 48-42]
MRKNNLLLRVKVAIQFIFQNTNRRIMTCGRCGSINIRPKAGSEAEEEIPPDMEEEGVKRIWHQIDICVNCGAVIVEKQYWFWS